MKKFLSVILLALLAACAPTSTTSNPTNAPATPTREGNLLGTVPTESGVVGDLGSGFGLGFDDLEDTPFAANVAGAVEMTVTGNGFLACENGVMVIRSSQGDFPQISLILPSDTSTENYALAENRSDGSQASAALFLADGSVYAAQISGALVLNSLAQAENEPVQGSFFFTAYNGTNAVEVDGVFSFNAAQNTVFCG